MINLDKRLLTIYNLVGEGQIADIGSDHGLLPAALLLNKKCKFAYLTDISANSLSKAEHLFKENKIGTAVKPVKTNLTGKFPSKIEGCPDRGGVCDELRAVFLVGDGLSVFDVPIKNCTCVIAGMGGEQIIAMLKDNLKRNIFDEFILQPMKSVVKVRQFLVENGYFIEEDIKVLCGSKFYDILKVKRGQDSLTERELIFGRTNLERDNPDFNKFLSKELKKFENAAKNMKIIDTKVVKYVTLLKELIAKI